MARYPLNLPTQLKQEAETLAAQQGVSLNQFILWAVAEKVGSLNNRLDDPAFPQITYRRGAAGIPAPVLRGTGIRVQTMVAATTNWGMLPAQIAEEYGIREQQVSEALAFYEVHRDEIDASIAEEAAMEKAAIKVHKIGIQTRPWGPEANRQRLPAVLADVKAAGYDGIEIGSQHLDISQPAPFRRLVADHGLALAGIHVGGEIADPQAVRDALARLEQTMAFAAAAGAPHLCFSGAMKPGKTDEELAQAAANLNRIGELAAGHGLRLAYHNHYWEIEQDCRELRFLRDHTDPALVSFLLDVAWVLRGGGDPVAVAREFLPRIAYFHLKDTRGTEWLELGEGDVDLRGVIQVMAGVELPWAVVEQDETKRLPIESARISREYLRRWLAR